MIVPKTLLFCICCFNDVSTCIMRNELLFYSLLFFFLHAYATSEEIEVVKFYPRLFLENSLECTGVKVGNYRVAMTKECVAAEKRQNKNNRMVVGAVDQKKKAF